MIINNQGSSNLMVNNIVIITVLTFIMIFISACSPSSTVLTSTPIEKNNVYVVVDSKEIESEQNTAIDSSTHYIGSNYPSIEYVKACAAKGGKYSKEGMSQSYMCVVQFSDAGKACKSSTDCQGFCRSSGEFLDFGETNQIGQCSSSSSPFGCHQAIEDGVAGNAVCID